MANEKVTLNMGGRQVQATPVEVNQSSERWNEYLLEDGTVLKREPRTRQNTNTARRSI